MHLWYPNSAKGRCPDPEPQVTSSVERWDHTCTETIHTHMLRQSLVPTRIHTNAAFVVQMGGPIQSSVRCSVRHRTYTVSRRRPTGIASMDGRMLMWWRAELSGWSVWRPSIWRRPSTIRHCTFQVNVERVSRTFIGLVVHCRV